jgi:hypothetical protein
LEMLNAFSGAYSFYDLQNAGVGHEVSGGEEMVRRVDVEPCEEEVGPESSDACVSIVGGEHGVFPKVFDPFGSFGPKFLQTMPAEQYSVEDQAKDTIDEEMKFEGILPVSSFKVEGQEDNAGDKIPEIRHSSPEERNHEDFEEKVEGLYEDEQKYNDGFGKDKVVGFVPQEIADRLQGCCFVVEFHVRVDVMAQTVHDLPLVMGETSQREAILEDVLLVVDEVVPDAHHRNQEERAYCSEAIGQVGLFLIVNRQGG